MPSAEYQRQWKAKKIAEDPNWLEKERTRSRESKRKEMADPERRARAKKNWKKAHAKRMEDPEYRAKRAAKDLAKYERAKSRNPQFYTEERRKKLESMSPEELKAFRDRAKGHSKKAYRKLKAKSPETLARYQLVSACRERGITVEDYEELSALQNGVCAICSKPCSVKKRLAIDHDHTTNEVRGLLCDFCNNGIGRFKDRIDFLYAAINYLLLPPNKKRLRKLKLVS